MHESHEHADLRQRYNYDAFVPAKFEPWMQFDFSPSLGVRGPDFPLWQLDAEGETAGAETMDAAVRLHNVLAQHTYTVVEFGSFT